MALLRRLLLESGFDTLAHSSRDVKLMCLQRFVRMYAYGSCYIILVQFFSNLGIAEDQIGLFMTLTLLGDAVISLVLTLVTDNIGRKLVLVIGSASMIVSGVVFVTSNNYWILLFASIFGVISPSGNEIGPFRAVEESILSDLTEKRHRSDLFAWYTLFGSAGSAMGTLLCGWTVQFLQSSLAWSQLSSHRVIFAIYALIGGIKLALTLMLSNNVEVEGFSETYQAIPLVQEQGGIQGGGERTVVFQLQDDDEEEEEEEEEQAGGHSNSKQKSPPSSPSSRPIVATLSFFDKFRALLPSISRDSLSNLYRLLFILSIDSFASGITSPSWMTYFFTTIHHLQPASLGTLFLVTNLLAMLSNFAALPLVRRIGPLLTMSATHLPSAIFLGMIPFPSSATPSGTWLAMLFLSLRACTQSMDTAPRQAFISASVLPNERTAVLGIVSVAKTLTNAGGIGLSGILAGAGRWKLMLLTSASLKITYDLLIVAAFYGKEDREDQAG